jgi:hypothetical protein
MIRWGNVRERGGKYVVSSITGSEQVKMKSNWGFMIFSMGQLPIRAERYSMGAVGGVLLPSPRLVPRMAAK